MTFGTGTSREIGSSGSWPAITAKMRATSETRRAIGPSVSNQADTGIEPRQDIRPIDGLRPATPQNAAGRRIDPPVSEPIEPTHIPAASDAPDPPLEPPGIRLVSQGLRTGP